MATPEDQPHSAALLWAGRVTWQAGTWLQLIEGTGPPPAACSIKQQLGNSRNVGAASESLSGLGQSHYFRLARAGRARDGVIHQELPAEKLGLWVGCNGPTEGMKE